MDERAIGGAGGDVGQRVRGVRGIDQVALEHHVGDVATQGDVVRCECAEHGLEIVDELGEGCVFKCSAQPGYIQRDFDG
jgi:hypothetical protein